MIHPAALRIPARAVVGGFRSPRGPKDPLPGSLRRFGAFGSFDPFATDEGRPRLARAISLASAGRAEVASGSVLTSGPERMGQFLPRRTKVPRRCQSGCVLDPRALPPIRQKEVRPSARRTPPSSVIASSPSRSSATPRRRRSPSRQSSHSGLTGRTSASRPLRASATRLRDARKPKPPTVPCRSDKPRACAGGRFDQWQG